VHGVRSRLRSHGIAGWVWRAVTDAHGYGCTATKYPQAKRQRQQADLSGNGTADLHVPPPSGPRALGKHGLLSPPSCVSLSLPLLNQGSAVPSMEWRLQPRKGAGGTLLLICLMCVSSVGREMMPGLYGEDSSLAPSGG